MLDPIIFNKVIGKACYYGDRFFDITIDDAFSFSLCYVKECKSMVYGLINL
jgi:fructosamine-3-kinase